MTSSTSSANSWFESAPVGQRPILNVLRKLILSSGKDIIEEIKWSRPCYSTDDGMFCYLFSTKSHATLGFQNGAALKDPKGLLEGEGKNMRHIKIKTLAQARLSAVGELIQQAAGTQLTASQA